MTDGTDLLNAFPYGAHVVSATGLVPFDMVRLSLSEDYKQLTGYAYPNKDMKFDLDSIEPSEAGWVVKSDGFKFRFTPLTQAQGQQVVDLLNLTGS